MVYMAKTGSPVASKTNRLLGTTSSSSSLLSASLISPEAVLLAWLVYGLLPLALTVGINPKDSITSVPAGYSFGGPEQPNNLGNNNITTYDCPTLCQCDYFSSSQTLDIRCSSSSTTVNGTPVSPRVDLSPGVRTLHISDALLVDAKSVGSIIPPLRENSLVELDLQRVTIEPKSLFTGSPIFRESRESLRRLTIKGAQFRGRGDFSITELPAASIRALLQPLASLRSLDSLNICDSSPSLASVVLQAMPAVKHLQAVNNSLYDIPYESLTTNQDQYSAIESLDFSRNHLSLIPNGLLEGLTALRSLDVSHNRIFHLQEQVFTGLKHLRELNVSHNQIEYVDAEVFTPLRHIEKVDLSHNEVVQFFGPYFGNNKRLRVLNLSNMWVAGTFASSDTATRSLMEVEKLINSLNRVERLDISENGMRSIPETLTHAPQLQQVDMDGNQWECSCQDRWFLDWVATTKVEINDKSNPASREMWCYRRLDAPSGEIPVRYPFDEYLRNLTRYCSNMNIVARTPYKFYAVMGNNKLLNCHAQKPNWPRITWITPSKQRFSENGSEDNDHQQQHQQQRRSQLEPRVSADGSLLLSNVTKVDYGLYLCIASYQDLNITHYVHLGVDVSIFRDVRIMSILVGWTFSFAFLLLVLLFQLVKIILNKLGVRCVTMKSTKQTRYVRAFFDSMEQHKNSQLDWLRDNYNMQAKKIKDNCYSQLERIRESYSTQTKNLGEFRDYGTQQLHGLRDQYNDQVRRVASYSAHQLCKVRENYVFKRNQVCKFSNHQMLRLRESYKWQAQTLNKILENLPRSLNFDTCRGMGACGRADSMYLDEFGEEFGCPTHHGPDGDIYHVSNGHHHMMAFSPLPKGDKLEHVSLLIAPEFVCEYKQRSIGPEGVEHPAVIQEVEEENDTEKDVEAGPSTTTTTTHKPTQERHASFEDAQEVKVVDEVAVEEDEDSSEQSTSTPPTLTLESSAASSRSGSYSSESAPNKPPDEKDNNDTKM